ncbi:unnamed protein product [Parascedosporium putredinis]|uniref:Uncharacterized protein n=1 Tax=Parascedosporium putredinis TaxID=1442378 RepID=A0A9P1M8C5_9PEZI|nr:unnamed protein product [Parascedosporium putredinis]CAI7993363.1 unnamed protein product [Parascedosporium putredinis]
MSADALSSLFALSNRTIAITGGARGLGLTLATAAVEAGSHVACLDVLAEPAPEEWEILQILAQAAGVSATYRRCDVTSEADVEAAFAAIAGEAQARGSELAGARMMRVNAAGVFITAKHAARTMIARGVKGSIVLVASMSGQIANRGLFCSAYNASKAAVQQLGRSLAQEWGQFGIRVNTLSPGYIRTAMTDDLLAAEPALETFWMAGAMLGRLGVPADFKAPVIFLLSDGSRFMTGADLRVDGGHCAAA